MSALLEGKVCELCPAPALWSIRRAEKESLFGGGKGMRTTGWTGPAHPRCGQHVASIDAIERAEANETLTGKGRRK